MTCRSHIWPLTFSVFCSVQKNSQLRKLPPFSSYSQLPCCRLGNRSTVSVCVIKSHNSQVQVSDEELDTLPSISWCRCAEWWHSAWSKSLQQDSFPPARSCSDWETRWRELLFIPRKSKGGYLAVGSVDKASSEASSLDIKAPVIELMYCYAVEYKFDTQN